MSYGRLGLSNDNDPMKINATSVSNDAKRYNEDKAQYSLLPVHACEAEARVWAMGAKKYDRDNWRKLWGERTTIVVMDSLLRHAFAILSGEQVDKESGLYHAAHIRCNAAMLIEYYKQLEEDSSAGQK